MVKKINFNDKQKFLLVIILMLIIIILPNVKANMCNNTFNHYKDYIEYTLENSLNKIINDLEELNDTITYDNKIIVSSFDVYGSKLKRELRINSEVNFSKINLSSFVNDPIFFTSYHLNKLKINGENFSISGDSFDEYYAIFKDTIFFDIFKDLNITHVNFNGTEYEINSNKENIKNIIRSSDIKEYLEKYPENFSMDFKVRIQDGLNNCTKNITLDFEFYNETIIVYSTIGSHSIKMTAEFEENSILIFFEYEDKILTFNVILDEYEMRIKAEFSNNIEQEFNENTDTPIVVNSSYDVINVNISNNISTIPKIDLGNLINSGKGLIPKITINASNANNIIINIPATNITSSNVSWDGIIETPTIVNVSIPVTQGKSRTQSIAIKVGFSGGKLTFSKAVKLTFPEEAGKKVAYLSEGNFNEINDVCGENTQNWADSNLNEGKECYINDGSDLVVWTKHFTEFVTYTESDVSSQRISKGGLCTTSWTCSAWSTCINGVQTRTCSYPDNFCTPSSTKPEETRFCSIQKPGIALNEPEDEIKAGLGLGAIIGGSASLYWILFVLVIIIITLIVILIKSKKEENKELKEKTEENEKVEESENNNLEDKKEVKISKEKDKKIIKKPKKVKKNKEKSKV